MKVEHIGYFGPNCIVNKVVICQELGGSNSSYSLANQLRLNPRFSVDVGRDVTFGDVENIVTKMRTEWKVSTFRILFQAEF